MITNGKNILNQLLPGKAGELTLKANYLTFSLLEKIFGSFGPYRQVLKQFGVKINDLDVSYLVLKDGIVYTDVQKEFEILWQAYPLKLVSKGTNVVTVPDYSGFKIFKVLNLILKTTKEALIVTNIQKYLKIADEKYELVSRTVKETFKNKSINIDQFLKIYEEIVYISYLYELIDLYNAQKPDSTLLKKYVQDNDYLLNGKSDFIDNYLKLEKGFFLDDYTNLEQRLKACPFKQFIPAYIIEPPEENDTTAAYRAEKKLQCLKNNLRLKTNILLYFLNLNLIEKAKHKGIYSIANKTLSDI